jgi:hypothetical protein
MAGTTINVKRTWSLHTVHDGAPKPFERAVYETLNNIITDLETLRAGSRGLLVQYEHEQLAAGVDIAARSIFEARFAGTVTSVRYIPRGNSAGIDGSNTLVVTLRNITASEDVATVTRTTNLTADTPIDIPITAANSDIASAAVLGITITQGAAADVDIGILQFEIAPQTVDAAADLVAASLATRESQD